MLINLPLNQLDKALVGCFSLSISLGVVWRRSEQLEPHVIGKLSELCRCKDRSSIGHNGMRNPEPMDDVLFHEINHIFCCHRSHGYRLHPFCEIIHDSQHLLVTFAGWRIDLADHIHGPTSEQPRLDDGIHY